MVVPAATAMEAQGTIGSSSSSSLIKRRVRATTTCIAFALPPQITAAIDDPSGGGGEPGRFALSLTCQVTMCITSAGKNGERIGFEGRRGGEATCAAVPDGEDGVRGAIRGMLRSIRPLQDLGLTDGEWDSIVPEDVVPKLADPSARACYAAAFVDMAVVRHVRFDAARVLMTACREVVVDGDGAGAAAETGGDGDVVDDDAECSVCFDALLRGREGEAVELPGCAHAFHRRCISKWFCRKTTCPLCRGDVVKHLDPELQKHITEFTDATMRIL